MRRKFRVQIDTRVGIGVGEVRTDATVRVSVKMEVRVSVEMEVRVSVKTEVRVGVKTEV